jgi:hypothetical protein
LRNALSLTAQVCTEGTTGEEVLELEMAVEMGVVMRGEEVLEVAGANVERVVVVVVVVDVDEQASSSVLTMRSSRLHSEK